MLVTLDWSRGSNCEVRYRGRYYVIGKNIVDVFKSSSRKLSTLHSCPLSERFGLTRNASVNGEQSNVLINVNYVYGCMGCCHGTAGDATHAKYPIYGLTATKKIDEELSELSKAKVASSPGGEIFFWSWFIVQGPKEGGWAHIGETRSIGSNQRQNSRRLSCWRDFCKIFKKKKVGVLGVKRSRTPAALKFAHLRSILPTAVFLREYTMYGELDRAAS